MTQQTEPEYRTAFRETGKAICPETGKDLSEWSGDGVRAHAENLFPGDPRDFQSDTARERKAILLEIAKAKG